MTFSVIAKSPDGQYIGVAVATKLKNVGRWIPFGSGLGGVFTLQALLTPEYRAKSREILRRLEHGEDPANLITWILRGDPLANRRQIQIMDLDGNQASFTGAETLSNDYHGLEQPTFANHLFGHDVSVAGNILSNPNVVPAMLDWYQDGIGANLSFSHLLIGTLQAAEQAGGDARETVIWQTNNDPESLAEGYSAALRVFKIGRRDPVLSLDINNSEDPIGDLFNEYYKLC